MEGNVESKICSSPGGCAFQIKLAEPKDTPPEKVTTPTKSRDFSILSLEQKLTEAEQRRENAIEGRMGCIEKQKERQKFAQQKIQEYNETFKHHAEEKLKGRLSSVEANKEALLQARMERNMEMEKHFEDVLKRAKENKENDENGTPS